MAAILRVAARSSSWLALIILAACGDNRSVTNNSGDDDGPPMDAAANEIDDAFVDPNLLVHFAFEDSTAVVTDSSGHGKDGELSDPAAWTADGRVGRGVAFTGVVPAARYVSLPNGIFTGTSDFTIAVWVKLNSVAAWARIYDIGNGLDGADNRFMYLTVNGFTGPTNDGIHAASFGGSPVNENIIGSNSQLPTGVWKHIALTGSAGRRTLYVDGFPVAEVTNGPDVPPSAMEPISPSSWLGRSRFGADPGLDGTLDEFRVYNKVLTTTEIADLAYPQADYSHWRFDENAGTTTRDTSDRAVPTALSGNLTWTPGRLGSALEFAGGAGGNADGPHVSLGASPLAGCTDELTVAVWVKLDALTAWSRIFDFGSAFNAFIYLAPTDGAGMHFAMVAPSGVFDMVSAAPPVAADGQWHHVAVTVAADRVATLYANGAVVKTQTIPGDVKPGDFSAVTELYLGRSRFPDPYLDGALDDLRISCRAYTADEIKNLAH